MPAEGPWADRPRRRPGRHRYDANPGRPQPSRADEVPQPGAGRGRASERPANTLGLGQIMFAVEDIEVSLHLR
jgi:hypothetical protein